MQQTVSGIYRLSACAAPFDLHIEPPRYFQQIAYGSDILRIESRARLLPAPHRPRRARHPPRNARHILKFDGDDAIEPDIPERHKHCLPVDPALAGAPVDVSQPIVIREVAVEDAIAK